MIDGVLLPDAHGMIKRSNAAITRLLRPGAPPAHRPLDRRSSDPRESGLPPKLASEVQKEPFRDRAAREFRHRQRTRPRDGG